MDCDKLLKYCYKNMTNTNYCREIYEKCLIKTTIRKRKSLPISLSKVSIEGKTRVFSTNTR